MASEEPSPDLPSIHDFLFHLALQAGDMITAANPSHVSTKKNSSDLVTETDKAVETMVSSALRQQYPSYAFLGEETAPPSGHVPRGPCFIVDPIDGTTNFVHAHPYISISLCFALDRIPKIGIVYNPFTQHLYHAIRGRGAFLTRPAIPTSRPPLPRFSPAGDIIEDETEKVESRYVCERLPLRRDPVPSLEGLDRALVAVEWGNDRAGGNFDVKTRAFRALAAAPEVVVPPLPVESSTTTQSNNKHDTNPSSSSSSLPPPRAANGKMVHSFRSLGSAALNCCSVARGDLDAYWEGGCWAWDVGAGWVVVEEAGGKVVGGNPGEWECEVDARRYLVVRGCGGGEEEQRRVIEGFWDAVGGVRGKGLVYE